MHIHTHALIKTYTHTHTTHSRTQADKVQPFQAPSLSDKPSASTPGNRDTPSSGGGVQFGMVGSADGLEQHTSKPTSPVVRAKGFCTYYAQVLSLQVLRNFELREQHTRKPTSLVVRAKGLYVLRTSYFFASLAQF